MTTSVAAAVEGIALWLRDARQIILTGQGQLSRIKWPQVNVEDVHTYFNSLPPVDTTVLLEKLKAKGGYGYAWHHFNQETFDEYYRDKSMWELFSAGKIWAYLAKRASVGFCCSEYLGPLFSAIALFGGEDKSVALAKLILWLSVLVNHHCPPMASTMSLYIQARVYEYVCNYRRRSWIPDELDIHLYYILIGQPSEMKNRLFNCNKPEYDSVESLTAAVKQHVADTTSGKVDGCFTNDWR